MNQPHGEGGLALQAALPVKKRPNRQHAPLFPCPCCGQHGKLRTSTFISHTLRRLTYNCTDVVDCGHVWTANLEFERTVHASRKGPVRQTVPFLRLKPAT